MKLLDILARELEIWPEGAYALCQDSDSYVGSNGIDEPPPVFIDEAWNGSACVYFTPHVLAEDHSTAIITREMWEQARAKLQEQPKVKANRDGWIRHRGGKCPVADDALVEFRMRDGLINEMHAGGMDWSHDGDHGDVMAYKIVGAVDEHMQDADEGRTTPIEEVKAKWQEWSGIPQTGDTYTIDHGDCHAVFDSSMETSVGIHFDGPLAWRDRIRAIDDMTAAMAQERASLIEKLAAEGFDLVEQNSVQDVAQEEDMGDWRVGDMIVSVTDSEEDIHIGGVYVLTADKAGGRVHFRDDDGDTRTRSASDYKWHSRPKP